MEELWGKLNEKFWKLLKKLKKELNVVTTAIERMDRKKSEKKEEKFINPIGKTEGKNYKIKIRCGIVEGKFKGINADGKLYHYECWRES